MAGFNPIQSERRLSWLRLLPPAPRGRSVVVLERRGGYRLVTPERPLGVGGYMGGGFWHLYQVETAPREVPTLYELPSRELARTFRADLALTVQVADAVKVVKERVTDAWAGLEPVLRQPLRQIGRRHGPDDLAAVEDDLHRFLTDRTVPEVGLRVVRAAVSVDLEGPDLKREREKLEAQHRRELDELHARHRTKLEKADAQHQQELRAQYEQHQHELELQRRKLYEEVVGEGLVPKLLLMKLAARPAGADPKDLDEVIALLTRQRVDDFQVPFDLLARYKAVIEQWQLEEPVSALLKHLIATYVPTSPPRLPDGSEEFTVTVGEPAPAGAPPEAPADPGTGEPPGTGAPPDDRRGETPGE